MRKLFTLLALGMMLATSLQAQEQEWDWAEDIARLNPEVVDSVVPVINPEDQTAWYQTCMIYYHQPLQHDNPSLGNIPLRALFTVFNVRRNKDKMVQMTIGGYDLKEIVLEKPNSQYSYMDFDSSSGEIPTRYDGHLLRPEHRFFGTSVPENPMENIEYCNAKEAAADFHALEEVVKKVFTGKWVISGVSKGGMCAAIQHAYYPDDADCFVPYVAPILKGTSDMRIQERSMTEPWTPEMREETRLIVSKMLKSPNVYTFYEKDNHLDLEQQDKNHCLFLADAYDVIASSQQLYPRSFVSKYLEDNKTYLKENGLEDYTDMMLAYMLTNKSFALSEDNLKDFKNSKWNEVFPSATRASQDVKLPPFSASLSGYVYQSLRELGYYGFKWDYFYDTQAQIDSVNSMWQSTVSSVLALKNDEFYGSLEYNPELMNFVCQQTASTTKPMLYIYGGDDFWAGAHIEDKYVNGDNVRSYILPGQNHGACISGMTDTDKQNEIWAFLDAIFKSTPVALEQIEQPATGAQTRYNLMGIPTNETRGLNIENGRLIYRK